MIMNNVPANTHRKLKALVAIVALSVMLVPAAFAQTQNFVTAANQNKQDFTLHNETGLEVKEVYISPTAAENWEEDILGTDTLETGDSVNISFTRRREDMWDMKVVFRSGKSNVWTKLNLSKITDVTLSFKEGKPWATWKNGDQ
jgi:pyruvate kinase